MKSPDHIQGTTGYPETVSEKRFWISAFGIAVLAEAVYWIIHCLTLLKMCSDCLQPPAYYIVQWLLHALFTGLVWYLLDRLHYKHRLIIVLLNLGIFFIYVISWILINYYLESSPPAWLSRTKTNPIDVYISISWFDVGTYVLKAGVFYVIRFYLQYRRSEQQRIALALINKDLQLNLLKQQLSPHFYFNTLNNLYGLARTNNPSLSTALYQLSNIMHYVIVDCNQPRVLLSEEISFLQSYIALEKLRYEENTVIDMQVEGNANGQTILPLMLIQFVENAFKHGMKEKSSYNWMKVNVGIRGSELLFSVDNSYTDARPAEGIGLESAKHCLHLQYDGKYKLRMDQSDDRFSVILNLNLS